MTLFPSFSEAGNQIREGYGIEDKIEITDVYHTSKKFCMKWLEKWDGS